VSALFLSNLLYNAILKNVPLVDIHVIAINFVIRVVSGAFIINLSISPWLIVVVFLLAIFLAVGKRKVEFEKFGQGRLKPVFRFYSSDLLNRLTDISAAMLLISYILFTAFTHESRLMLTIPLATFLVFRYLYFIHFKSEIAAKSERVFLDKQMLIGIVVWIVLSIAVIYSL
jgi:4-hydroxybenzoate polyprenyltransferase